MNTLKKIYTNIFKTNFSCHTHESYTRNMLKVKIVKGLRTFLDVGKRTSTTFQSPCAVARSRFYNYLPAQILKTKS